MKKLSILKEAVCKANRKIGSTGLAALTWGNASAVDRDAGVIVIKPSGVEYEDLEPDDLVTVDLSSGKKVEGTLKPSSDTPTHLHLYRSFQTVGGIVHTHSHFATAWAQARREIPCMGTTHADTFHGSVPITRDLCEAEIKDSYEVNTGKVIEERFRSDDVDPVAFPGALVPGHGPFAWGPNVDMAIKNAMILEHVARMAYYTLVIAPESGPIRQCLLDKHYFRKHGKDAYYGQG